MDSRGIKRKFYEVTKNDLSVELHKLTIDSGKYSTDVQAASDDFQQMLKALCDRQAELLTTSVLIQEQYSTTFGVLEKARPDSLGEGSGENVDLPPAYANDIGRLVADSNTSLKGHVAVVRKEIENMEEVFHKTEQILKENMEQLRNSVLRLEDERARLSAGLHNFVRYVPDVSDEEDEED